MALDYNVIGDRIKNYRVKNKLTQEKLAEKLDISVPYLSRIECGDTHVSLKRLNQICEILNITEGDVLNGSSTSCKSYLLNDFSKIFSKCSPEKIKLIYSMAELIAGFNEKE